MLYRLRSLIVAIALVSVSLAWVMHHRSASAQDHEAVRRLRVSGRNVIVSYAHPFQEGRKNQSNWRRNLGQLLGTRVVAMEENARNDSASSTELQFKVFSKLERLTLRGQVNTLAGIGRVQSLRQLDLTSTTVHDISELANLKSLSELDLSFTKVEDVTPLGGLLNLRRLRLKETAVRDVSPLKELISLQYLYLGNTQVTDVSPIARLMQLRHLALEGTAISDIYLMPEEFEEP